MSKRIIRGGRERNNANLSMLFPISGFGKRGRKRDITLGPKCNLVILNGFQVLTFSLSSYWKENLIMAVLLYKITQEVHRISSELPHQQNRNGYF
jgi:hypothetical protein